MTEADFIVVTPRTRFSVPFRLDDVDEMPPPDVMRRYAAVVRKFAARLLTESDRLDQLASLVDGDVDLSSADESWLSAIENGEI